MRGPNPLFALLLAGSTLVAACAGEDAADRRADAAVTDQAEAADTDGPYLLVVNKSSNTLSVVDPVTGGVVKTLQTGFAPHEVVETLSVAPHSRPHGVDVAADGTLWVTTEGSAHVLQLDPGSGEILQAVETGQAVTHMVAVAEEAGRVVTANIGSGTITIVDPEAWEILRRLPVGAAPIGILITPDNRTAFVANTRDDKVTVIDLVKWEVAGEIVTGDEPDGMAWTG